MSTTLRVALGVASERQQDWQHLSQEELDVTGEQDWFKHYEPESLDNILAEHVWEHLTWSQALTACSNCLKFLKPGGRLRLAVPDMQHPSTFIVDMMSATGSLASEHGHLVDYTCPLMTKLLEQSGFDVCVLDWWDENGVFHNHYTGEDPHGYIIRSAVHWPKHPCTYREPEIYDRIVATVPPDLRNDFASSGLAHTSLIVDGIKPL